MCSIPPNVSIMSGAENKIAICRPICIHSGAWGCSRLNRRWHTYSSKTEITTSNTRGIVAFTPNRAKHAVTISGQITDDETAEKTCGVTPKEWFSSRFFAIAK